MPTYLVHGFRWQRPNIRIHIIMHDLEDAAPDWIMAPASSTSILNSFYTLYDFLPPSSPPALVYPAPPPIPDDEPLQREHTASATKTLKKRNKSMASLRSLGRKSKPTNVGNGLLSVNTQNDPRPKTGNDTTLNNSSHDRTKSTSSDTRSIPTPVKVPSFNEWSVVKLLEQFNPDDMYTTSQPYAYVADYMVEVTLGVSITEEMAKYESKLRAAEAALKAPSPPGSPGKPAAGIISDIGSPATMSAREVKRISKRLGWFEKLRDGVQKGEDIGWHVVVCGDEERALPSLDLPHDSRDARASMASIASEDFPQRTPKSAGLKNFFGRRKTISEH